MESFRHEKRRKYCGKRAKGEELTKTSPLVAGEGKPEEKQGNSYTYGGGKREISPALES